ncbi:transglycosylase domain-containing protein [Luedemannella helvata]
MRKRDRSLFANAAALLICGVLAGVVVAAAAFPAIAMGGLAMKSGSEAYGGLPSQLQVLQSPQISYVYASDNKTLIATIYDENRHDIPLAQIPKIMQNAIIAAEDQRFYEHNGVDVQGVIRAYVANQNSDSQQGASTLTMQYVRQALTYFSNSPSAIIAATERTNARKLKEIKYAMTLETQLTKDQILERYLNIAAFGNATYGIYAASQVFFNKIPKNLTLGEAALLAGLVKAPSTYDPTTKAGRTAALDRRQYVLSQMVKNGFITQAEADTALKTPLKIIGKRTPNGCTATRKNHWGFFCDYLYRWWMQQEAFGSDASSRENKLKAGGYRIVTTLDVKVQEAAKKNIEKQVPTGSSDALMIAAVEPGTGKIKAMATNRKYGLDTSKNGQSTDPAKRKLGIKGTYPTTTNPLISGGGDITGYKMGSTFKMFTMVAALEEGYTLDYPIAAKSPYKSKYIVERNSRAACKDDRDHWCPVNANPSWMNGVRNMWTGFGRSVNTYFVPLQERVGAEKAVDVAKRLGIQFRAKGTKDAPADYEFATNKDLTKSWGPFTLGVSDAVPLEMANAYATLAADGKYCEPIPVAKITDHDGNVLNDVTKPRCNQAVKADVARAAVDAARCAVGDRSSVSRCDQGTASWVRGVVGKPVMGKTGTTDDLWTATLALSTKQLAVAGTMADPDHAQANREMSAPKTNYAVAYTMRDALKGKKSINFTPPSSKYTTGKRVSVPSVTCRGVDDARSILRGRGFQVEVDSKPVDSSCPAGTVARTDPDGWTVENGYVLLYISNGKAPTRPTDGPGEGGQGGPGGPRGPR